MAASSSVEAIDVIGDILRRHPFFFFRLLKKDSVTCLGLFGPAEA